jgi:hypothetical protein
LTYTSRNNRDAIHADVPLPAGAVQVDDWDQWGCRYFTGSKWLVERDDREEDIECSSTGSQHPDGRLERLMHVHRLHADDPINPAQARQLARALIAAADEYETLTTYDEIEVTR